MRRKAVWVCLVSSRLAWMQGMVRVKLEVVSLSVTGCFNPWVSQVPVTEKVKAVNLSVHSRVCSLWVVVVVVGWSPRWRQQWGWKLWDWAWWQTSGWFPDWRRQRGRWQWDRVYAGGEHFSFLTEGGERGVAVRWNLHKRSAFPDWGGGGGGRQSVHRRLVFQFPDWRRQREWKQWDLSGHRKLAFPDWRRQTGWRRWDRVCTGDKCLASWFPSWKRQKWYNVHRRLAFWFPDWRRWREWEQRYWVGTED